MLPRDGSWCIVDVVELDGATRRLAIAHPDPAKQALAQTFADRWFPTPAALGVLPVDAGQTECATGLGELDVGRLLVVPLVVRGTALGAITYVTREGHAPLSPEEITLASNLADLCALALDNARLYRESTQDAGRPDRREHRGGRLALECDAAAVVVVAAERVENWYCWANRGGLIRSCALLPTINSTRHTAHTTRRWQTATRFIWSRWSACTPGIRHFDAPAMLNREGHGCFFRSRSRAEPWARWRLASPGLVPFRWSTGTSPIPSRATARRRSTVSGSGSPPRPPWLKREMLA